MFFLGILSTQSTISQKLKIAMIWKFNPIQNIAHIWDKKKLVIFHNFLRILSQNIAQLFGQKKWVLFEGEVCMSLIRTGPRYDMHLYSVEVATAIK